MIDFGTPRFLLGIVTKLVSPLSIRPTGAVFTVIVDEPNDPSSVKVMLASVPSSPVRIFQPVGFIQRLKGIVLAGGQSNV